MEQLTASQLAEWEAFYRLEPTEDLKDDIRFGLGMSTLANLLLKAHFKGGKEFSAEDFLINWEEGKTLKQEEKEKPQTVESIKDVLMQMAKEQNKKTGNVHGIRKNKRLKK